MHLRETVRALVEMRCVPRPDGIVGIREVNPGSILLSPMTPMLEEWLPLLSRVRQHHGNDPFAGRHHRRQLLEAGFVRSEASAFGESTGSLEQTRRYAAFFN